jgi:hypothetical protein
MVQIGFKPIIVWLYLRSSFFISPPPAAFSRPFNFLFYIFAIQNYLSAISQQHFSTFYGNLHLR